MKSSIRFLLVFSLGLAIGVALDFDGQSSAKNPSKQTEVRSQGTAQNPKRESGWNTGKSPSAGAVGQRSLHLGEEAHPPLLIDRIGKQMSSSNDPVERMGLLSQLLAGMTPKNAMEMRKYVLQLGERSPEFEAFHYAWGKVAGEEAFNYTMESDERDAAPVLRGWGAANPEEAQEWLAGIDIRTDLVFTPVMGYGMNPDSLKKYFTRNIVLGVLDNDTTKAAALVSDLSDSDASTARRLAGSIADKMVQTKGVAAAREWIEMLPEGDARVNGVGSLVREWARLDHRAALDYSMSQTDPNTRLQALRTVWTNIGYSKGGADPAILIEELRETPHTGERDRAFVALQAGSRWNHPELAVQAALEINDPSLQRKTLIQAGGYYLIRKPEEAQNWMYNSGLEADDIAEMQLAADGLR